MSREAIAQRGEARVSGQGTGGQVQVSVEARREVFRSSNWEGRTGEELEGSETGEQLTRRGVRH